MNKNWKRVPRMTDPRPGITVYPPVMKDPDGMVYVIGAIVGGMALVALVMRWI